MACIERSIASRTLRVNARLRNDSTLVTTPLRTHWRAAWYCRWRCGLQALAAQHGLWNAASTSASAWAWAWRMARAEMWVCVLWEVGRAGLPCGSTSQPERARKQRLQRDQASGSGTAERVTPGVGRSAAIGGRPVLGFRRRANQRRLCSRRPSTSTRSPTRSACTAVPAASLPCARAMPPAGMAVSRSVRQLGRKLSGWGHSCARLGPQLRQSLYIPVACATCTPLFLFSKPTKLRSCLLVFIVVFCSNSFLPLLH